MPSGQAGLFYSYRFGKFSAGTELFFIPIEGCETLITNVLDQTGNPTGELGNDTIRRHIYYLGVPLYFGYYIKKFNFNLGAQFHYALASGGEEQGHINYNGGYYRWNNKSTSLAIDKFDIGVRAGVFYNLNDKFSIEANYYYGFNNLISDPRISPDWKWKVQQMTIGLRYGIMRRETPQPTN